jgi:hypothetical protein
MIVTPQELADLRRLAQRVISARQVLEPDHNLAAYAAFDIAVSDLQARLSPERVVSMVDTLERMSARLSVLEAQLP